MKTNFFDYIVKAKHPYIIAELGANHNGDMTIAKQLIDAAKKCGCDAAKFQSWTAESLIAREEYDRNTKYNDSAKKHFGSLREMVEKYALQEEQHFELAAYCKEIGIDFASSPFSNKEVDLLIKLDVPYIKVASMDVNNLSLLRYIAKIQKPIIISTGMASMAEIENAIKTIESEKNFQIVLLHCISIYPPLYQDINLNNIVTLKQTFGYPVGFSDHTIGTSIPLASVVLGSCIIEKHFTLDKDMPGWDHEISANPKEMEEITREAKNIADALGSFQRIVSEAEEQKKIKFRRSIISNRDLKKGEVLMLEDFCYKRPGSGIAPDKYEFVVGRKLNKDVAKDEILRWEDLE